MRVKVSVLFVFIVQLFALVPFFLNDGVARSDLAPIGLLSSIAASIFAAVIIELNDQKSQVNLSLKSKRIREFFFRYCIVFCFIYWMFA